jgi:CHAT domain-containing protein/Tfp pilus assembly protein PilF
MKRLACLACLVLAACTSKAPPDPLYDRAAADLRRGNLPEARREVVQALNRWQDPRAEWHWRFVLLEAEVALAEGKAVEAQRLLSSPIPAVPNRAALEARRRMHLANAANKTGDFAAASRLLDEAAGLAPKGDAALRLDIDVLRGSMLAFLADPAAEPLLRASLARAIELKDAYNQAAILNNLGLSRMKRYHYDEAVPYYTRALAAAEQYGAGRFAAAILGNLAACQYRLGDFEKALAYRTRAMEMQRRTGALRNLQASLGEIGTIHVLQGEARQAIPFYQQALAIARELNAPDFVTLWSADLAMAYAEVRDWDAAERMNAEALQQKASLVSPGIQAQFQLNEAVVAVGRGRTADAERIYRSLISSAPSRPSIIWEAHAELGDLYTASGRPAAGERQYQAALDVIDRTRAGLLQRQYKITFLDALIRFYRHYVDVLVDRGASEKALQVADSSRARLLAEKIGLDRGRFAGAATNYRALARDAGAVLVSYWLAPERSLMWVVTADRVRLFKLPGEARIRPLVEAWNRKIADLRDPLAAPDPDGARLYDVLLGQAAGVIRPGSRVILVPDGVLHRLNFETLPVGNHYWIEDVTIVVAPSLGVLTAPGKMPGGRTSVLLIGDPAYRTPDFPRLPHASEELQAIQRRLAGAEFTVYSGERAQPAVYRSADPARFSIVHFAAHAVSNPENPLESAIVLAPDAQESFKLYARDVLDSPLEARLVTLSACRSAGARSYSGEGLVGLAWAFLQAGAANVIGGLWDVSDRSTAQLMSDLYAGLAAGEPPPDALRGAKLAMLHSKNGYRKPFYWAPFLVYTRTR